MTTPPNPVPELLTLPPRDLAELVNACPGRYVSERAAVLGLDVAAPEHHRALVAAFPDDFRGLDSVPAGHEGVRSDLTPNRPDDPTPDTGEGTAPGDPQGAAELIDLPALLAAYRGRPEPFMMGTFALYSARDGSVVMVTEMPGRGVENHTIPGKVVQLAISAMNGGGGLVGKFLRRG